LKEESSRQYKLVFRQDDVTVKDGFFIPSSRSNELLFEGNMVKVTGNKKINNLNTSARLEKNSF
jgi:hypothetical protein